MQLYSFSSQNFQRWQYFSWTTIIPALLYDQTIVYECLISHRVLINRTFLIKAEFVLSVQIRRLRQGADLGERPGGFRFPSAKILAQFNLYFGNKNVDSFFSTVGHDSFFSWGPEGSRGFQAPEGSRGFQRVPVTLCGARRVPAGSRGFHAPSVELGGFHETQEPLRFRPWLMVWGGSNRPPPPHTDEKGTTFWRGVLDPPPPLG